MAGSTCAETRASTTTRTSPASPLDLWPPAPYTPIHYTSAKPQIALLIEVRHFYHDAGHCVDLISELVDPVVKSDNSALTSSTLPWSGIACAG